MIISKIITQKNINILTTDQQVFDKEFKRKT